MDHINSLCYDLMKFQFQAELELDYGIPFDRPYAVPAGTHQQIRAEEQIDTTLRPQPIHPEMVEFKKRLDGMSFSALISEVRKLHESKNAEPDADYFDLQDHNQANFRYFSGKG